MMKDFIATYRNRPASTEDFKAIVEKHMTDAMNINGDGKMDWFFNAWVYGMQVPSYKFEYTTSKGPQGVVLKFKLTQSNVSEDFRMPVPIYLDFGKNRVVRMRRVNMVGNNTAEHEVTLPVSEVPKTVTINYFYDVLARN